MLAIGQRCQFLHRAAHDTALASFGVSQCESKSEHPRRTSWSFLQPHLGSEMSHRFSLLSLPQCFSSLTCSSLEWASRPAIAPGCPYCALLCSSCALPSYFGHTQLSSTCRRHLTQMKRFQGKTPRVTVVSKFPPLNSHHPSVGDLMRHLLLRRSRSRSALPKSG